MFTTCLRIPFPHQFANPKGDWRVRFTLAKFKDPSGQSKLTGRFFKVTVDTADDYRALTWFYTQSGVEFKSFMLKEILHVVKSFMLTPD
ncbi:hypothetical protein NPIL_704901 [Nephila pilipes]|uniref:Uncharacterized protein n=1 Tax=Nephila pilipes TaxID=299642 RepID=A0A8X6QI70_NEPPI|nr:hypothetical protein NPIL_704901 [Nephila pilipes]